MDLKGFERLTNEIGCVFAAVYYCNNTTNVLRNLENMNHLNTTPRNPVMTIAQPNPMSAIVPPSRIHRACPINTSTAAAMGICIDSPTDAFVGLVSSTARAHR